MKKCKKIAGNHRLIYNALGRFFMLPMGRGALLTAKSEQRVQGRERRRRVGRGGVMCVQHVPLLCEFVAKTAVYFQEQREMADSNAPQVPETTFATNIFYYFSFRERETRSP